MTSIPTAEQIENDQWDRRRKAAQTVLTYEQRMQAIFALQDTIESDRERLKQAHIYPDPERIACRLRTAEHAYFRLAGPTTRYWPAVYR